MVAVWAVAVALFGHWVFDFVCQPNWMGTRKSKEWLVLAQHSIVITMGGLVTGIVIAVVAAATGHHHATPGWFGPWALINGGAHFVIDAVTSRMTTRYYLADRRHAFFVTIGFDQFLHVALAVATLAWLVRT